ncbi:MAG: hypothetical protein ACXVGH_09755, partial [Mycobacteriales bacterium]
MRRAQPARRTALAAGAALLALGLPLAGPARAVAGAPAPCPTQSAHPWCDRSLSADQRALLLQRA